MAEKRNGKRKAGRDIDILLTEEVEAIRDACSSRAPTGIRNRALITVLWRCGLRASEVLALKPGDLNPYTRTLKVQHGKGCKTREVPIGRTSWEYIDRWIDKRQQIGFNGRQPLFCTLKGTPISDSYVRHLLLRKALQVGIEKRVHPHGLRHTFAYELSAEGVEIGIIRRLLGHSHLSTTCHYLDHKLACQPASVWDAVNARPGEAPPEPTPEEKRNQELTARLDALMVEAGAIRDELNREAVS